MKEPYEKEIDPGLESLQHEVGGWIEALYPFDDEVAIICNEEGKLDGLPLNRALTDEDGAIYDVVAGTFLVVGLSEDDFDGLSKDLMDKYKEHFLYPEKFIMAGGHMVALQMREIDISHKTQERPPCFEER
ncbi:MAG: DUF3846 domain-containing protein [Clostridia bacterium]|nr:DUF3846 domain-containing protein [Clostridia bacterium]